MVHTLLRAICTPAATFFLAHTAAHAKKVIKLMSAAAAVGQWQSACSCPSCRCTVYPGAAFLCCYCCCALALQSRNAEEALLTLKSVSTDLLAAQHAILSITSSSSFARRRSFSQPFGSHLHAAAGQSKACSAGMLARGAACTPAFKQTSGSALHWGHACPQQGALARGGHHMPTQAACKQALA